MRVSNDILFLSTHSELVNRDLDFILTLDIDWVALSFVQRPEDIIELKNIAGNKVKVMAKLEKPSAVGDNLEPVTLDPPSCHRLSIIVNHTIRTDC